MSQVASIYREASPFDAVSLVPLPPPESPPPSLDVQVAFAPAHDDQVPLHRHQDQDHGHHLAPEPQPRSMDKADCAPAYSTSMDQAQPSDTTNLPEQPPLLSRQTSLLDALAVALPRIRDASSILSDPDPHQFRIDHDYDGPEGHRILRMKPTPDQWADFPDILAFARQQGAAEDGCFKIVLPEELHEALPYKATHDVPANAYKPFQTRTNFWRVATTPSKGSFTSTDSGPECAASAIEAVNNLKKLYRKSNHRQIRNVRYRVDVPAWTPAQRRAAGVPERSPIHPLKGDKLDKTKAAIPGIHTPYVYESGPHFGASFQIHAEDFRLVSLNHLYKGRKIWIVVPSTSVDTAEEALGRKGGCSQFMRHRAEFFFPEKLQKLGIPFRIVDQRPGETIVILPDAYHEGFSTGYTIAEAKNYADSEWSTDSYQPCEVKCQLATAIPAELMRPLGEGEARLDLCASYEDPGPEPMFEPRKRQLEEEEDDGGQGGGDTKKVKE